MLSALFHAAVKRIKKKRNIQLTIMEKHCIISIVVKDNVL